MWKEILFWLVIGLLIAGVIAFGVFITMAICNSDLPTWLKVIMLR